jgi:glyoxylase-like metal-dependent hydrolase (beta-lactamase superfamily II)
MANKIDLLDFGGNTVPKSMTTMGASDESMVSRVQGFLIRGDDFKPIVVDTGYRNDEIMASAGFPCPALRPDQNMEAQLARFGLTVADIGLILISHLHIDHSGQVHKFPMTTPVMLMRREVEVAIAGSRGHNFGMCCDVYPAIDMQDIFDRAFTPGALVMLDLDLTGPLDVAPGVMVEATGGHTEGSMTVRVTTDSGVATLCGDLIYNVAASLIERRGKYDAMEASLTREFTVSRREEAAAVWRALSGTRFLLPAHDLPAVVENGRVVGRIDGTTVPGPVERSMPR